MIEVHAILTLETNCMATLLCIDLHLSFNEKQLEKNTNEKCKNLAAFLWLPDDNSVI